LLRRAAVPPDQQQVTGERSPATAANLASKRCGVLGSTARQRNREPPMQAVRRLATVFLLAACTLVGVIAAPAQAVTTSRCMAIAQASPDVQFVAYRPVQAPSQDVRITFVGHATFRIESPDGIVIATDYAGYAGSGPLPDIVTMNHAHSTHYTNSPDPRIKHVLRGWGTDGQPAQHHLEFGDVFVRNVTTDIRSWMTGQFEKDGNSIFIFEVGGLCIGHLGHLHHTLGPEHLGLIGQLDVVMVPVDGSYTMDQAAMIEVLQTIKARLIIPMHMFGPTTLQAFLRRLDQAFEIETSKSATVTVSAASLPPQPKVLVLQGGSLPGGD
jgi:L-ascorbate metabolism protein UlaG (beta-lactamase superfamily)